MSNMRIGLVGRGHMGEALIAGLLKSGLVQPTNLIASGKRAERALELENRYGITTARSNVEAVFDCEVIILAVKPQIMSEVLAELKGQIPSHAVVLSIAAGIRLSRLRRELDHECVVRAMPNTPAAICAGVTVWTAAFAVSDEQRERVREVLSTIGIEEYVSQEEDIDKATAVSGTGPALVFLIMAAFVAAGVRIGMSWGLSRRSVLYTFLGAVQYAIASDKSLDELANHVTSPAGTTGEATHQLHAGGYWTTISQAIMAAFERAKKLGQD